MLLGVFAVLMAGESIERIFRPVEIAFNQAVFVAVLGLIVNGASVLILGDRHGRHACEHGDPHQAHRHATDHDYNLRAAYLHVMADALTSLLAIFALLAAKYLLLVWMDPLVGIVGAVLVSRWSWGLLHSAGGVLLDEQAPEEVQRLIKAGIESDGDSQLADLHVWSIGPSLYGVIASVVAHRPKTPEQYKDSMPSDLGLAHVTVEVHQCEGDNEPERANSTATDVA